MMKTKLVCLFMNNIVKFDTAIQLNSIGYKPDDLNWRSCVYYAVNEVLIKSDYGDSTLNSGELFTEKNDDLIEGKYVYAPCYSEVQQWMYKNHRLFIEIHLGIDGEFFWNIQTEYGSGDGKYYSEIFESYDEYFKEIYDAYESAILKCIEYIKSK